MKCPHCLQTVELGATRCNHCTGVIPISNSFAELVGGCFAVVLMAAGVIWVLLKMFAG